MINLRHVIRISLEHAPRMSIEMRGVWQHDRKTELQHIFRFSKWLALVFRVICEHRLHRARQKTRYCQEIAQSALIALSASKNTLLPRDCTELALRQNVVNRIAGFYPKRGFSTRTNWRTHTALCHSGRMHDCGHHLGHKRNRATHCSLAGTIPPPPPHRSKTLPSF